MMNKQAIRDNLDVTSEIMNDWQLIKAGAHTFLYSKTYKKVAYFCVEPKICRIYWVSKFMKMKDIKLHGVSIVKNIVMDYARSKIKDIELVNAI